MALIKRLKLFIIGLFAICAISGCCLLFAKNVNIGVAYADSMAELQKQESEILKYYHMPTVEENFEVDRVNIILRSTYGGNIGFEDFSSVEEVCHITSMSFNLKTINKGDDFKFTLQEYKNAIFTLYLDNSDKENIINIIRILNEFDFILVAEPAYIYETEECIYLNDEFYKGQWSLNSAYGIQADKAWEITQGSEKVKVGIMETGIDMKHPDLNGRVYESNFSVSDSANKDHGTLVAGIIGAQKNNIIGIAGIADCSMYLLNRTTNDFATSLAFAEQSGIKIINASFMFLNRDNTYAPYNATHYTALSNYSGLVVAASGNDNRNLDGEKVYPACYDLPNIITVGSTDRGGSRSSFSNYGQNEVDIYAPGEYINSTYPNNTYKSESGTSLAAPHVTGVAALILSVNPDLTAAELKELLIGSSDFITIKIPSGSNNSGNQVVRKLNAYNAVNIVSGNVSFNVTFDNQGGEGGPDSMNVFFGQQMSRIDYPTKYGYTFEHYYDDYGNTYFVNNHGLAVYTPSYYKLPFDAVLHAYWSPKIYDFRFEIEGVDGVKDISYGDCTYDDTITITAKSFDGYNFLRWWNGVTDNTITIKVKDLVDSFGTDNQVGGNIFYRKTYFDYFGTLVYEQAPSCIAENSLITLADGRQKAVQDLIGNERLLVWNLHTGTFDTAPILFIDSEEATLNKIINLYFSDGTEIQVIYEHAFWDFDLNKYVFLRDDASQYIGHWFNKHIIDEDENFKWTRVQLIDVIITEEFTVAYSPVTYGHLCYYVNGMLSMPGATEGFINIFAVDSESMQYNTEALEQDINTYGLYTYEEFAEIYPISEEVFNTFGGQYLKVSIGKGMTDIETIGKLIDHYSKFLN